MSLLETRLLSVNLLGIIYVCVPFPINDFFHFAFFVRYQGFATPYYKETHVLFRRQLRAFTDKVRKKQLRYIKNGSYPLELHEEFYKAGEKKKHVFLGGS